MQLLSCRITRERLIGIHVRGHFCRPELLLIILDQLPQYYLILESLATNVVILNKEIVSDKTLLEKNV